MTARISYKSEFKEHFSFELMKNIRFQFIWIKTRQQKDKVRTITRLRVGQDMLESTEVNIKENKKHGQKHFKNISPKNYIV